MRTGLRVTSDLHRSSSDTKRHSAIPCTSSELALAALRVAIEQKSHDPCVRDVSVQTDIADFFVIASATSARHAEGIADNIRRALAKFGEEPIHVAGHEEAHWIVLDYGNIVVHIFHEPVRQYYDLDGLWSQAPRVPTPADLEQQMKQLRTGMYF